MLWESVAESPECIVRHSEHELESRQEKVQGSETHSCVVGPQSQYEFSRLSFSLYFLLILLLVYPYSLQTGIVALCFAPSL